MQPVIREMGPLRVVGFKLITDMQTNEIPKLWERFWSHPNRPQEFEVVVGLCYGCGDADCPQGAFKYMAGVVLDTDHPLPEGLEERIVPAAKYAVFTHHGPLSQYGATIEAMYQKWIPESGIKLLPGDHVEWYDCRFKGEEPDSEIDICMPIE
jgi:AraC family transcriptional regulator